ncbi:MAG: GGDEF domain-containing protein [Magnetococcales bacterium]|nr:GGDEF domain-containing protein [Magnetococcales bacterium]
MIQALLKKYPLENMHLFLGMSQESVGHFLEHGQVRHLAEGEVLLRPGMTNAHLFIVLAGRLRVHLEEPEGDPIAFLESGECAGELSLIEARQVSAWVLADREVTLLALPHETVWALVNNFHAIARNLLLILSRRIRLINKTLVAENQRLAASEYNARVDALTGLFNRRWLDEALDRLLKRQRRNGSALGVVLIDADHFKRFNDTYGHLSGDCALRTMARTIRDHLRPGDHAARYGGEEMVVLLPDSSREEVERVGERLRQAVEEAAIHGEDGQPLPGITISCGMAIPEGDLTSLELLALADSALYRAKAAGRNRVSW